MVRIRTVSTISRSEEDYTRDTSTGRNKVFRNYDPTLATFSKEKEYVRALNAAKLQRLMAKPFLSALSGHRDSIHRITTVPGHINLLLSGASDGEVRLWDLSTRQPIGIIPQAHTWARGIAVADNGVVLTCGDSTIKMWNLNELMESSGSANGLFSYVDTSNTTDAIKPVNTLLGDYFTSLDVRRGGNVFGTTGKVIQLWDQTSSQPTNKFTWGEGSPNSIKFNILEPNVFAVGASDRAVQIYDARANTPIARVVTHMRNNALSWNPMNAMNIATANEDTNSYIWDVRRLETALIVCDGHTAAVMDIEYSPTGLEVVTGSYDKTVRIWVTNAREDHVYPVGSYRELYHLQRMQQINCVKWSSDARFIFTGSSETNVRIWKADAAAPLKILTPKEQEKIDYSNALISKYARIDEVGKVHRSRRQPKAVFTANKQRRLMIRHEKGKEKRKQAHAPRKYVAPAHRRLRHIVQTE